MQTITTCRGHIGASVYNRFFSNLKQHVAIPEFQLDKLGQNCHDLQPGHMPVKKMICASLKIWCCHLKKYCCFLQHVLKTLVESLRSAPCCNFLVLEKDLAKNERGTNCFETCLAVCTVPVPPDVYRFCWFPLFVANSCQFPLLWHYAFHPEKCSITSSSCQFLVSQITNIKTCQLH